MSLGRDQGSYERVGGKKDAEGTGAPQDQLTESANQGSGAGAGIRGADVVSDMDYGACFLITFLCLDCLG